MTIKTKHLNRPYCVRLTHEEGIRFWQLMDIAEKRSPYVNKSDVMRELLGLVPPTALTPAEIKYFRTGNAFQTLMSEMCHLENDLHNFETENATLRAELEELRRATTGKNAIPSKQITRLREGCDGRGSFGQFALEQRLKQEISLFHRSNKHP